MAKTEAIRNKRGAPLDPSVRALGVVSLLNDFSSEVAVRTLPLFLANVLGVRIGIIGLIEGIAESTATLLKLVSGYLADRSGRKKGVSPMGIRFFQPDQAAALFRDILGPRACGSFLDRVGKGIRSAPRDALIADITPPELRGRAFGFNKAMDKTGGFLGLIVAAAVLYLTQQDTLALTRESYEWLVLLAVLPGLAAIGIVAWCVEERPKAPSEKLSGFDLVRNGPPILGFHCGPDTIHPRQLERCFSHAPSPDRGVFHHRNISGRRCIQSCRCSDLDKRGNAFGYFRQARIDHRGLADLCGDLFRLCLRFGTLAHLDSLRGVRPLLWRISRRLQRIGRRLSPRAPARHRLWDFQCGVGRGGFAGKRDRRTLWDWYGPPAPFLFGAALAVLATIGLLMIPLRR